MTSIETKAINHLALTVTDMNRARDFYQNVLGFEFITEFGPKYLMSNGEVILALNQAPDPTQAISNDRFSENRVGLDHISFNVGSMAELENAVKVLDE
jgi:catechol 2,3-dioxygenase-like lactoylglutathione lyase family enzyme